MEAYGVNKSSSVAPIISTRHEILHTCSYLYSWNEIMRFKISFRRYNMYTYTCQRILFFFVAAPSAPSLHQSVSLAVNKALEESLQAFGTDAREGIYSLKSDLSNLKKIYKELGIYFFELLKPYRFVIFFWHPLFFSLF